MGVDLELRARADAVATLQASLQAQWRPEWVEASRSREYEATLAWWHVAVAAFLDPVRHLPESIRAGDPAAIEAGLVYLETAPRCHRSGYMAERLMRRLSQVDLTPGQRTAATKVVIAETEERQTRGWRDVGALAGSIWDEALGTSLAHIAASGGHEGHRATRTATAAQNWLTSTGSRNER